MRPRDGFSEIRTLYGASGEQDVELSPWVFHDDAWPEDPEKYTARHAEMGRKVVEAARASLARLPPETRGGP